MQRVCFCKTVSLFNHVLQPSQAIAVFYQSLLFSLKNIALVRWISSHIDIPTGLQLLMIDINGNVTVDDELLYKQLSNAKRRIYLVDLGRFHFLLLARNERATVVRRDFGKHWFVCVGKKTSFALPE
jgi:hypothetical protein